MPQPASLDANMLPPHHASQQAAMQRNKDYSKQQKSVRQGEVVEIPESSPSDDVDAKAAAGSAGRPKATGAARSGTARQSSRLPAAGSAKDVVFIDISPESAASQTAQRAPAAGGRQRSLRPRPPMPSGASAAAAAALAAGSRSGKQAAAGPKPGLTPTPPPAPPRADLPPDELILNRMQAYTAHKRSPAASPITSLNRITFIDSTLSKRHHPPHTPPASARQRKLVIKRLIATGGWGIVLEALDTSSNTPCALKLPKHPLDCQTEPISEADVAAKWRMFCRGLCSEAHIMAQLDCPYAMPLLAQGVLKLSSCLVPACLMPLGRASLQARWSSGATLSEKLVQRYMVMVIRAVAHMGQKQLVHRDIRAANIIEFPGCQVKLCDFSISLRLHHGMVNPGEGHGCTRWAAPEMMQDAEPHDERADSWSLGATALELLTRALPWPKDSIPDSTHAGDRGQVAALLASLPGKKLKPGSQLAGTLSEDACSFIRYAMNPHSEARPYPEDLLQHRWLARVAALLPGRRKRRLEQVYSEEM